MNFNIFSELKSNVGLCPRNVCMLDVFVILACVSVYMFFGLWFDARQCPMNVYMFFGFRSDVGRYPSSARCRVGPDVGRGSIPGSFQCRAGPDERSRPTICLYVIM